MRSDVAEGADPGEHRGLRAGDVREARRGEHLVLAVGVEVQEAHLGWLGLVVDAGRRTAARRPGRSPSRVSARYSDHATPRSATSTRRRNDGMTLRSSTSIICGVVARLCGGGAQRIRSSSCS